MIKDHLNSSFHVTIEHLENQLSDKSECSVNISPNNDLKSALSKLFHKLRTKWQDVNRIEETFFAKHNEWLNASVAFLVTAVPPAVTQNIQKLKPVVLLRSLHFPVKEQNEEKLRRFVQNLL